MVPYYFLEFSYIASDSSARLPRNCRIRNNQEVLVVLVSLSSPVLRDFQFRLCRQLFQEFLHLADPVALKTFIEISKVRSFRNTVSVPGNPLGPGGPSIPTPSWPLSPFSPFSPDIPMEPGGPAGPGSPIKPLSPGKPGYPGSPT